MYDVIFWVTLESSDTMIAVKYFIICCRFPAYTHTHKESTRSSSFFSAFSVFEFLCKFRNIIFSQLSSADGKKQKLKMIKIIIFQISICPSSQNNDLP